MAQVQIQYAQEQASRQKEADMAPRQKQVELERELCKVEAERQTEALRATTLAQVCRPYHIMHNKLSLGILHLLNALSCSIAASFIFMNSTGCLPLPPTTCPDILLELIAC